MQPDPDPLPPLADVFNARAEGYAKLYRDKRRTDRAQLDGKTLEAEAAAELAAPYDADRQRLREAIAAKDRAFCTAPLHGLKPEFFAFCEIEGESPEIQFFESAEEASKAADEYLERAEELLCSEWLTEEPEIAYGRIYARCETHRGPAPEDADYDETWSMEMISRMTAEAENERLRARVAELEQSDAQGSRDQALAAGEYQLHAARMEARLAKYDALAKRAAEARSFRSDLVRGDAWIVIAGELAAMAPEVK